MEEIDGDEQYINESLKDTTHRVRGSSLVLGRWLMNSRHVTFSAHPIGK